MKKLWRAIDGTTFFPLTFKAPLIVALDSIKPGLGTELQKLLLHNAGLYHLPIEMSEHAPSVYAEWLQEFSEANTAMVADVNGNGRLDSPMTYKEVLDVIEKSLQVIRELEKNTEQQTAH
ncbi:hypothetical protein [Thiohalophilus sp.]|uniref:hypothetical protein n=1 Tax=Thiohalophilus sp. TaxID=3028392 RepID=UPI002ACDD2FE|nr:hypothetical protein [Thiohalophilus sp.]MDZ7804310.1 hypothetical protein [Thiohalophilus sp.]